MHILNTFDLDRLNKFGIQWLTFKFNVDRFNKSNESFTVYLWRPSLAFPNWVKPIEHMESDVRVLSKVLSHAHLRTITLI